MFNSLPNRLPPLPVEVYQEIFRLATSPNSNPGSKSTSRWRSEYDEEHYWQHTYKPFSHTPRVTSGSNAHIRCRLLLVCQLWHSVGQRLAYETVFIGKHATSLLAGLARSAKKNNGLGYGQFVRKIVFCTQEKSNMSKTTLTRLLAACPNVKTIVREAQEMSIFPVNLPSLSTLRRFDWWTYHKLPGGAPMWRSDAVGYFRAMARMRSEQAMPLMNYGVTTTPKDLYLLRDIVSNAPNLEYLSIEIKICAQPFQGGHNVLWFPETGSVTASITTLRLSQTVPWITEDLNRWSFPLLEHLVLSSSIVGPSYHTCLVGNDCKLSNFWPCSLFNPNIRTIEITDQVLDDTASLERTLVACPNVTELSLEHTSGVLQCIVGMQDKTTLRQLQTIRVLERAWVKDVAAFINPAEEEQGDNSGGVAALTKLYEAQWQGISTERFPALRRVFFVGDFTHEAWHRPQGFAFSFFAAVSRRLGDRVRFFTQDGRICEFDQSVYEPAGDAFDTVEARNRT